MLKARLFVVLMISLLPLCGCFMLTDQRHNRAHWEIVKKDLRIIHQDMDLILHLNEESYLDITGR